MRGEPIDTQRLCELQDRGLTKQQIAELLGVHPHSVARRAADLGRPFQRAGTTRRRRCICCRQLRATEARWICRHCRADHQRQGLVYIETHSLPGGIGRD